MDDAIREAEELVAKGHREVVLTGVNIGRYEQDGHGLIDLIRRLERITGLERIRISSIEPTTIPDELLDYMASSSKLCRYLHIPLQSGDDGILRAMNRRYTVGDYTKLIEKVVGTIPDVGLGTDLLVGFPGEGEKEFSNTLRVAEELPFSYFHVFSFSKRPGTAAARLANPVNPATIKARTRILSELSRAKRLAFYQKQIGRTVEVLFETKSDEELWTGLTSNFMKVGVPSGTDLTNLVRNVVITGAMDGLAVGCLEPPAGAPSPPRLRELQLVTA